MSIRNSSKTLLQMDLEELWDRQHALARALSAAKVAHLLEALIAKTSPEQAQSPLFQWSSATAVAADATDAVHTCSKVDAIKVGSLRTLALRLAFTRAAADHGTEACSAKITHCSKTLCVLLK